MFLLPLFPSPSIFLDHPSTWTRPPLQIQHGLYYLKECFLFPPVADMTPHHSPNQTPTCLFGHWLLPRFLWSPFSSGNRLLGLLDFTAAAAFSVTIQEPWETLESRSAGVSSEGIELWDSSCVADTTYCLTTLSLLAKPVHACPTFKCRHFHVLFSVGCQSWQGKYT